MDRTVGAIRKVVEMTAENEPEGDFWDLLALRIEAGVSREMIPLIEIQGVGRGRAKKLFDRDIRTLHDIEMNREDVEKILGPVVGPKVVSRARKILRERMKEEDK